MAFEIRPPLLQPRLHKLRQQVHSAQSWTPEDFMICIEHEIYQLVCATQEFSRYGVV